MTPKNIIDIAEAMKNAIDWENYPKLAEIFENRPSDNIYWHELVNLTYEFVIATKKVVSNRDL